MRLSGKNLLILLPGTVWGISFILVELILVYVPPITITLIRGLISVIMLLILMRVVGSSLPNTWRDWYPFVWLAAFNQAVPFALTAWGQQYIDGGLASILLSVMPLFTVLLAFWFTSDETLSWLKLLGIGLGFVGILVLIGPSALEGIRLNFWAQMAVIFSALLYAIGAVYLRHAYTLQPPGLSPWELRLRITTGQFVVATLLLLPFSLWLESPWTIRPTAMTWVYLFALGIGVTGLATIVYFYLIEEFGAGTASFTIYLIPVAGVITGVLVLDEALTLNMVAALVLIVAGVFVINQDQHRADTTSS